MATSTGSNPSALRDSNASKLWTIANQMRGTHTYLPALLEAAVQQGLNPTWRDLARLTERGLASASPSEALVDFLRVVVGATPVARLLDPWAEFGVLLAGVSETQQDAISVFGLINDPRGASIGTYLLPGAEWLIGQPLAELQRLKNHQARFDLIICAPPWNTRTIGSETVADSQVAKLTLDQQLVLESCELLTDDGRAFFILPNSLLLRVDSGFRSVIKDRGIDIWSIIALPPSWIAQTSIPGNLIELRRGAAEDVFVARASADSNNEALVGNHSLRCAGKVPEVGAIVELNSFTTWETFENGLAFEEAARTFGSPIVALSDILLEKFLGDRTATGGFEDRSNSVFLPSLGTSPAVTSSTELTIKPHNYIQLVLDTSAASAEYVANYLNTPLGERSRRLIYTGAVIKRASLKNVGLMPVVLPTLDEQTHAVSLQRRITELRAELSVAERDLWRSRSGMRRADRALQDFASDNTLDTWLSRLPFPLASILWNYGATLEPRRKVEILFAFFEATSEFLTTILLSGLRSNQAIFEELKLGPLSEIEGDRWREASLGFWVKIGMNLAKTLRKMLSDQNELCLELFRCSSDCLGALTSKDLFKILERVGSRRNEWKGHGGIESGIETAQRLETLQTELADAFTPLTLAFEDLILIRPMSMQFDGQLYELIAEELTGPVVPFRESSRQMVRPLRSGSLVLLDRLGRDGLELLPLIRMHTGPPAETACYFYSRLNKDGARFVSYHQAQESEVVAHDLAVEDLVNDLVGAGSKSSSHQ